MTFVVVGSMFTQILRRWNTEVLYVWCASVWQSLARFVFWAIEMATFPGYSLAVLSL